MWSWGTSRIIRVRQFLQSSDLGQRLDLWEHIFKMLFILVTLIKGVQNPWASLNKLKTWSSKQSAWEGYGKAWHLVRTRKNTKSPPLNFFGAIALALHALLFFCKLLFSCNWSLLAEAYASYPVWKMPSPAMLCFSTLQADLSAQSQFSQGLT